MTDEQRGYAAPRKRQLQVSPAVVILVAAIVVVAGAFQVWNMVRSEGSGSSRELPTAPTEILGVEVLKPVSDQGRIPLNTPAEATWYLRNTGTETVRLDKPSIEVLEGC